MSINEMSYAKRAIISTLLRKEALVLRAAGAVDDASELAALADEVEMPTQPRKPAQVNGDRDLAVGPR